MFQIKRITVGEVYTNCYICKSKENGRGFIVDPGDDFNKIIRYAEDMECSVEAILLTHGHFDHIGAVEKLKQKYNAKIYASVEEEKMLLDSRINMTASFGSPISICADEYLRDGQRFNVAGFDIKFILTPGHTTGSGCFYLQKEEVLFSGDTLFQASRGRTDFPGGSESAIIRSIREKLLVLPGDTAVLPGHMDSTTIEDEKVYY